MEQQIMKKYILALCAGAIIIMSGCSDSDGVGVCTGYSSSLNRTYCYSNFSSSECSEYDSLDVNGASPWYFYSGQTCADRDLSEGSN